MLREKLDLFWHLFVLTIIGVCSSRNQSKLLLFVALKSSAAHVSISLFY